MACVMLLGVAFVLAMAAKMMAAVTGNVDGDGNTLPPQRRRSRRRQ